MMQAFMLANFAMEFAWQLCTFSSAVYATVASNRQHLFWNDTLLGRPLTLGSADN